MNNDSLSSLSSLQSSNLTASFPLSRGAEPVNFRPLVSKDIQQLLTQVHRETGQSLKCLHSIKQISVGEKYAGVLKRIDSLANFLLLVDEVTREELREVETCKTELKELKLELMRAIKKNEIKENIVEEVKKGVVQADKVLIQLGSLTETIINYQKVSQPLSLALHSFCEKGDKDPLAAIDHLNSLLLKIPGFANEVKMLGKNQPEMSVVKLQDMHQSEMKRLEEEIDFWIEDTEKALQGHLKHLFILFKDKDGVVK